MMPHQTFTLHVDIVLVGVNVDQFACNTL